MYDCEKLIQGIIKYKRVMKMRSIIKFMMLPVTVALLLGSCTKETSNVRLDPGLGTTKVFNLTSNTATVTGFVVAEGDGFTEKGVCYDIQPSPTIDKMKTPVTGAVTTAAYNVTLTGLDFATQYYARAYATGAAGTFYGEELSFITLPILPTVTTAEVTDVEGTTAISGGNVSADGGAAITSRGVCYSTSPEPTIDDGKTTDGDGLGDFVSSLTGLKGLTTYHLRAYATNSAGTVYGEEFTFTTLVSVREWWIPGDYVSASYPGSGFTDWSPGNSPMVKSNEANPNNVEGYVYMANATNSWKFASQPDWDGPNYGPASSPGELDDDPGADDFSLPAGYYRLRVDAGVDPMTYTAIAMVWGVTGDLTGWGSDIHLGYDPELQIWKGAMHMPVGGWKFRANDDWDLNYGADAGSSELSEGGDNIATALEGDYAVTLDLSRPLDYTYRADMWGLIGDATPGGWDNDTDMTWDAVNGNFKVTVDLTSGTFKFRANHAWDYDLGGDAAALCPGGANIPVAEAGNYTITLDPWAMTAAITKN